MSENKTESAGSELTDSHCHLADPRLLDDVDSLIDRAHAAGVTTLISVGAIGTIVTTA